VRLCAGECVCGCLWVWLPKWVTVYSHAHVHVDVCTSKQICCTLLKVPQINLQASALSAQEVLIHVHMYSRFQTYVCKNNSICRHQHSVPRRCSYMFICIVVFKLSTCVKTIPPAGLSTQCPGSAHVYRRFQTLCKNNSTCRPQHSVQGRWQQALRPHRHRAHHFCAPPRAG